MFIRKKSFRIATVLLVFGLLNSQKTWSGGNTSGGGNDSAAEFKEIGQDLLGTIGTRTEIEGVIVEELRTAIGSIPILPTLKDLKYRGRIVDAKNYPGLKKIKLNENRWKSLFYWEKRRLVLHEYLSVIRQKDKNYDLTYGIMKTLGLVYTSRDEKDQIGNNSMFIQCDAMKSRYDRYQFLGAINNARIEFELYDTSDPKYFGHANYVAQLAKLSGFVHSGENSLRRVKISVQPRETVTNPYVDPICQIRISVTDRIPIFSCDISYKDSYELTFYDVLGKPFSHKPASTFQIIGVRQLADKFIARTMYSVDEYKIEMAAFGEEKVELVFKDLKTTKRCHF